jgi:hypothetical protein
MRAHYSISVSRVRVCESLSCELAGARELLAKLPNILGRDVRVVPAPCVGRCESAPAVHVHQNPVLNATLGKVSSAVETRRTSDARLEITATLPRDGFLVINETWYPGFRIRVDGQPVAPLRTNVIFMGVPLAAGRHVVSVAYAPGWLYAALLAAAITFVSSVGVLAMSGSRAVRGTK